MSRKLDEIEWLNSAEVRKRLKLTTCDLAHLREAGELSFKKEGNAYFYKLNEVGNHTASRLNSRENFRRSGR